MIDVLAQIATGIIVLGMFALAFGFAVLALISLRIAFSQPDFWESQWGSFTKRMQFRARVGAFVRERENRSRSGRIADWFLRRGTLLLIAGGIAKAIVFAIERRGA